jgi:hypothetical protein
VTDADSPRDTATPPADDEVQSPATPRATANATAFVVPSSTPSNASAPDATAIVATVQAALPATITPDASGLTGSSLGETAVVAIWQDDSGPYFAAITTGMMDDIETPHPLTIYQKQGNTFVAVTHYDYVDGEYVVGIELIPNIDPKKSFFVVYGGIGAHSGFGTVFRLMEKISKSKSKAVPMRVVVRLPSRMSTAMVWPTWSPMPPTTMSFAMPVVSVSGITPSMRGMAPHLSSKKSNQPVMQLPTRLWHMRRLNAGAKSMRYWHS